MKVDDQLLRMITFHFLVFQYSTWLWDRLIVKFDEDLVPEQT